MRLIDQEPNTRVKPMRILCLGLTRTGTNSLATALRKLGYNPYHGSECFKNPPRDFNLWIEALQSNQATRPYGREEFDRLLGPYDACLDIPAAILWKDLYAAYPDAKVILTTRDPESWWRSMDATLFRFIRTPLFRCGQYLDRTEIGPLYRMSELVWKVFCANCYEQEVCLRAFVEHYASVRAVVPADRLLELPVGCDGWGPLCGFLHVPVPDEPWPWEYSAAVLGGHIDRAYWRVVRGVLWWVGVVIVVVFGAWWVI
ncbi:P-loop containing nucleoside triphosphate hydrolase protein [Aspergillus coremiiformis]|uniref:P-loop containing nucleoside triphosphate hydrolase protein n=1 Tax=Aspergillus coremiiformis TaxID=138285 RepID=A0A5N6YVJ8_9EURO|nr:P-loop containing nucleoside triphosphate hydrolase protein [Aspergillus coremiiformis]